MVNEDYIIAQPVCAQMAAPRLQLLHMFGRQDLHNANTAAPGI
jgi:hypothetical protein